MKNSYSRLLLEAAPRIISHLDRDSTSPTHGCFDRPYWLYHLTDFPSAILQQSSLTLALLYANNFPENIYYQNPQIREWALAAISYWKKIQNKDGSFNEYWQGESSLPATVFSTFAVSETARIFELRDQELMEKLRQAGAFMAKNAESFAANQEVAAVSAIYSVYLLTRDKRLEALFRKKFAGLKALQSSEGFFYEQGGADAGYLTVSLNYLGWLFKELQKEGLPKDDSTKEEIKAMCERALHFLSHMIHPDGSLGGEYGSRNTEYLMPGGLVYLAKDFPLAESILQQHEKYLFSEPRNFPVDDRYLLHYFGPSFAWAAINLSEEKEKSLLKLPKLPFQEKFSQHFADAGLFIVSRPNLYLIINLKKGGVFKLYSHGKCLANDLGYRIKDRLGKIYFSEFGHENPRIKIDDQKDWLGVRVTKRFSPKEYLVMNPAKRFTLYLFSIIFGPRFRSMIKRRTLKQEKDSPYWLVREIKLSSEELMVADQLCGLKKKDRVIPIRGQSIKLIPSAKFFQVSELTNLLNHSSDKDNRFISSEGRTSLIIDLKEDCIKEEGEHSQLFRLTATNSRLNGR